MDGERATTTYVLDGCANVVPCVDPQAWDRWMSRPENTEVLKSPMPRVGRLVRTVFTGKNEGTADEPVFFETFIEPLAVKVNVVREGQSMVYARVPTWTAALVAHDKAMNLAARMLL